jgi:hypothetical protein
VQKEIDDFCQQQGLPPGIMPLKMDFVRANRYDLSHAVERWGGLYELAETLGYQVVLTSTPSSTEPHVIIFCTLFTIESQIKFVSPLGIMEFKVLNQHHESHPVLCSFCTLSGTLRPLYISCIKQHDSLCARRACDCAHLRLGDAGQVLTVRGENEWSQHVAETAAETGLSGTNGLFEVASRTYRLRRSQASMSSQDEDSASDEDESSANGSSGRGGTQVIRTRSIIRKIASAESPDGGGDGGRGGGNGRVESTKDGARERNNSDAGSSLRRGRGSTAARGPKSPASGLEGRLRDEIDAW